MNNRASSERSRLTGYSLIIAVAIFFLVLGIFTGGWENVLIAIPTVLIAAYSLCGRRREIFIPIPLVVIMTAMMVLLQVAKFLENDGVLMNWAADFALGAFMSLVGLIVVYGVIGYAPGFDHERPFSVALTAFCIAVTFSIFIVVASYGLGVFSGSDDGLSAGSDFSLKFLAITAGALVICVLFYANRHSGLFAHTLDRFLRENAPAGSPEAQRRAVENLISGGESSRLEFKSTLRTNLKTGEKDPRIEKAVLKTLVAFLNTRGGTLLIGVADDGTIVGIDEESFEGSRDRFSLHLNHLIENQIGKEFLPFISYLIVDFDGKGVMRVDCRRSDSPVFLIGKDAVAFFVRSGPSSIDLYGTDLLYYANRNFGRKLKRPQTGERK